MQNMWRFPLLDGGSEQGFNNGGIATFKGSDLYDNLAREICQNSLDAKRKDEQTVIVKFKSISVDKNKYSALFDLNSVFEFCESYWKEKNDKKLQNFLFDAKKNLRQDNIDILIISDYNTTGLSGAKATMQQKSVWRALTHSDGVTNKSETSAGSYGIGKNAPFACSSLRTVFYNTYAIDGIKAFQGVSRLVTHINTDGEYTQGVGFYQKAQDKTPIFIDDKCEFRDLFNRNEYGTDVIIPGINRTDTWIEDIEKAILNNFFVSILAGKLEVEVNNIVINKNTIQDRITHYYETYPDNEKIKQTMEFYNTITDPNSFHKYTTIIENNDIELFIKKDENYSKTIAEMRAIGMVVRIRSKNILSKYSAVLIVNGDKLNEILKNIEPPKHDKWDPDIIDNNEEERQDARRYKSSIVSWVNNSINDFCKGEMLNEIDPEGVSEYLPYDDENFDTGDNKSQSPTLEPNSQLRDIKNINTSLNKISVQALATEGVSDTLDDVHNHENGGLGEHGTGTGQGYSGNENKIIEGNGSKNLLSTSKDMFIERIFAVSENNGIYKIVLKPKDSCEKIEVSLKALGDDGRRENILINKITIDSKSTSYTPAAESFNLWNIEANKVYEIFVTLEYKEKMLIELQVR